MEGPAGGGEGVAFGAGGLEHVGEEVGQEEEEVMDELQLPLWERSAWSDLEPLHLVDPSGVVAIDYDSHHVQALGFFRRILERGELSHRALELTAEMISLNQADYTAWEWRWRCLRALQVDLRIEYIFTDGIMRDNAKNYQLWNHRRKCALALGEGAARRELEVAAEALSTDSKNYHAWAHRQAIVAEFGGPLWEEELSYLEQRIRDDLRNNSAWNQRAFVLTHQLRHLATAPVVVDATPAQAGAGAGATGATAMDSAGGEGGEGGGAGGGAAGGVAAGGEAGGASGEGGDGGEELTVNARAAALAGVEIGPALRALLQRELRYVAGQVARAPRNESSWNYLRGLFRLPGVPPLAMAAFDEVGAICRDALLDAPSSPCALDLYAAYYEQLAHVALKRLAKLPPAPAPAVPAAPAADQAMGAAAAAAVDQPAAQGLAQQPQAEGAQQLQQQQQQPGHGQEDMVGVAGAAAGAGNEAGNGEEGEGQAMQGQQLQQQQQMQDAFAGLVLLPARMALETAVGSSMILLESLTIADPVRVMYWRHRQQGVQELLQLAGAVLGGGGGEGEGQQQAAGGAAGGA